MDYDIMDYIKEQQFPEGISSTDRRYIMKMATKFFVSGENLYKRFYDSILLRCVDATEATRIMQELHEGRVARSFNRKVRPRHFEAGDLVLRKVLPLPPELGGKFAPNYKSPYVVKKTLLGRALILTEMDGCQFSNPVNSDAVKKYYP
ncbi:uncharacterized protein LOC130139432 [Syzygium oleosum]|uniref:uncharacterized protein LOC130139432 n=1 Tax=Syzygium oleosum TaxID=219896 RepID=UPI0024B8964A|nr:uncharacterized protein LOC130139432 [Syzygium oleosum]